MISKLQKYVDGILKSSSQPHDKSVIFPRRGDIKIAQNIDDIWNSSSLEPLPVGQFYQNIFRWREFSFVQIKDHALFQEER